MPPIIVNNPVRMKRIHILIPKSMVSEVVRELHEHGAIHVEEMGEKVREYISLSERINKLINTINNILSRMKGLVLEVKVTRQELESIDIDYIERDVSIIYSKVEAYINKRRELEDKLRYLKNIRDILMRLPRHMMLNDLSYEGKYISTSTILGRADYFEQLIQLFPQVDTIYVKRTEQIVVAVIVYPSIVRKEVKEKLNSLGFTILDLTRVFKKDELRINVEEAIARINGLIDKHVKELNNVEETIRETIGSSVNDLGKYLVILENIDSRLKALISSYTSKYLVMIGGWIPVDQVEPLINSLREKNIPLYYELHDPVKGVDEPPTLLRNPAVIKWYEPIVKFIGMPRYWEWDPTPIIAYSFALFFGIMLGDMGYAIAIILSALFILDKFVVDPSNRDYRFFKYSLIVSSIIGFVIGFLSGSFFGFQLYTLTSLFIDPLSFLVVALIIGLIHVNISHLLTLVKSVKERDTGTVLSEAGLFIAEVFGIPYILYAVLNKPLPFIPENIYGYLLYGAFIGVATIVVGMVKSIGGLGLLMWLFNLTGLLGDVLSYSRLAGVGLATVFLGASFNTIAFLAYNGLKTMVPNEVVGLIIGGLMAALIMGFGHVLNTALSALGGFIHSLRLCFVEFLSKFYEGTGYPFEPLRIVLHRRIVIE